MSGFNEGVSARIKGNILKVLRMLRIGGSEEKTGGGAEGCRSQNVELLFTEETRLEQIMLLSVGHGTT